MSLPKLGKKSSKRGSRFTKDAEIAELKQRVANLSLMLDGERRVHGRLQAAVRSARSWETDGYADEALKTAKVLLLFEVRELLLDLRKYRHEFATLGSSERALRILDDLAQKGPNL